MATKTPDERAVLHLLGLDKNVRNRAGLRWPGRGR
jgi:hypothetical protein